MMHDETIGEFCARASGTEGCEMLSPDGEIVAWTTDGWWAAVIVRLLNAAEERDLHLLRAVSDESATGKTDLPGVGDSKAADGDDSEATAREAISHLAFHGLALRWDLPGEPSEAVRRLVATYFSDGEIVGTLSELACRYVMKALADDHLGAERDRDPRDSAPERRRGKPVRPESR